MIRFLLLFSLLMAGCDNAHDREARYLQRGETLFAAGQYDKARLEYKNALRIRPTDPEIYYRLGLIDEKQLNVGGAFGSFLQAEQQDPHYQPALVKIAEYDLAAGQAGEAAKRVATLLGDTPGLPEGQALQGALLLRNKDYRGAEAQARLALGQDPANITAFSVLSGLYLAEGQPDKAGETVDAGIARNPGDISLLLLKVKIYGDAGDLAKIDEAYQAIFALQPDEPQYRLDLATIYTNAGHLDAAEAALRAAIAARPDDWQLKHTLVRFLGEHRGLEPAEAEIHAEMQANPDRDELYSWLADLYIAHNATDQAVALLQQIVERAPDQAQGLNARTALARIDFVRGDKDLANRLIAAVLAQDKDNRDALLVRANLAYDQGNYEDAASDLRTILNGQARDRQALQLLAETLVCQGHLELAADTLADLVDLTPDDPGTRVRLAQLREMAGDHQGALDLLAIVTKTDPAYAVAWETEARLAIANDNPDLAQKAIQTLARLDGQQQTATFLTGQLAEKSGHPQNAIAAYAKIIDADPTTPLAEHALAALVQKEEARGDLDAAATYLATVQDKSLYARVLLGEVDMKLGRIEAATAALDAALAGNPKDPQAWLDRARLQVLARQPEAALALLKKAEAIAPGDLRASLMEADILGQQGNYAPAMAIYEDLLKHHPGLDIAANNYAALIAVHAYGDPALLEKAGQLVQHFDTAQNPALLDTLAWVDYRRGKVKAGLAALARVAAKPEMMTPEMHYHYGALLLQDGEGEQGRQELALAVTPGAAYPGLEEAKKLPGENPLQGERASKP